MTVERYDPPANLPAMLNPEIDAWIQRLEPAIRLTELTYSSELIPQSFRGRKGDVLAGFIRAGELRLSPFAGISQMHSINGRVGIYAELMRALIFREGHDLHIPTSDAQSCTIRGHRSEWNEDRWTTVTFTITDAAKAGLLEDKRSRDGKVTPSMYKRWPQAMLLARATTVLARMIFPDVIAGMRSIEELQEMVEPGEVVESIPAPPVTAQVSRQSAPGQVPADEPTPVVGAPVEAAPEQQPAASTTGRKRAPLTRRGAKTPPPAAEPAQPVQEEAQPSLDDQTGADVMDAEVVEDEGDPEAKPANPDDIGEVKKALRQRSVATVQMQFERLLGKPVDRAERLLITGAIVGRPVESTNELGPDELAKVLAKLERTRDRDALVAILNTAGGES